MLLNHRATKINNVKIMILIIKGETLYELSEFGHYMMTMSSSKNNQHHLVHFLYDFLTTTKASYKHRVIAARDYIMLIVKGQEPN